MNKESKKKCKKCKIGYGGYSKGPAVGHLDTQLFPGTEGTKFDRNIVKKTVERRKKGISPYAFNLKEYKLAQSQNKENIDSNTKLIGKFKTITDAGKICIEKYGRMPKAGYEMTIDEGTTPFKYKTYLQNNGGKFRIWTWMDQGPSSESFFRGPETKTAQVNKPIGAPFKPQTFYYYINLDERGSFLADVRNESGKTLFEIRAGNELGPNEVDIFEDGFMKNKNDLEGLKDYLIILGIMKQGQLLIKGN